jgi:hypothetical protein
MRVGWNWGNENCILIAAELFYFFYREDTRRKHQHSLQAPALSFAWLEWQKKQGATGSADCPLNNS